MNIQTVSIPTRNKKNRFYSSSVAANSIVTGAASPYISQVVPDKDGLGKTFESLKNEWVRRTMFVNSMSDINDSEPLKKIIALGAPVIPLILADLKSDPKHWFFALRKLTGANPIKVSEAGNLSKMRAAWLNWASKKGITY